MIFYDFRHSANPNTGLARYSWSVLTTIINDQTIFVKVLIDNQCPEKIKNYLISCQNIELIELDFGAFSWKNIFLQRKLSISSNDLFVFPHFNPPLFLKNVVFVVHDLLPLVIEDYMSSLSMLKKWYFAAHLSVALRRFTCITVSETTKNDLRRYLPKSHKKAKKIKVIHEDIPIEYPKNQNLKLNLEREGFLFYVGDWRPHKNIEGMLELYRRLRTKGFHGKFIIAGSSKEFTSQNLARKIKLAEGVEYVGKLSDDELKLYLLKCRSLFFLTHYEGFGLPILEAGFLGKKVITNCIGGAAEISPPWAFNMVSRNASEDVVDELLTYLQSDLTLSGEQISAFRAKFNWNYTAKYILEEVNNVWN